MRPVKLTFHLHICGLIGHVHVDKSTVSHLVNDDIDNNYYVDYEKVANDGAQ